MRNDLFLFLASVINIIVAFNVTDRDESIAGTIVSVICFVGAVIVFELRKKSC